MRFARHRSTWYAEGVLHLVIDINVLFGATAKDEPHHEQALSFLLALHPIAKSKQAIVYEPPLFGLEIFATFNRQANRFDPSKYPQIIEDPIPIEEVEFTWEDVHELQFAHSLLIKDKNPQHVKVKGGDLIYLGIARKYRCPLVTVDGGLLKYNGNFCSVMRPETYQTTYLSP